MAALGTVAGVTTYMLLEEILRPKPTAPGQPAVQKKVSSEIINNIVTNIVIEDIQTCDYQIVGEQSINVSGSYNIVRNVTMRQAFQLDVNCYQDVNRVQMLQTKLEESIKQVVKTEAELVAGKLSPAVNEEIDAYIHNDITNNITNRTLQQIAMSVNQKQGLNVSGDHNIAEDITMDQFGEMVIKSTQQVASTLKIVTDIKAIEDTISETTVKVTEPMGWLWTILIILAIVIAMFVGYKMVSGGKEAKEIMIF